MLLRGFSASPFSVLLFSVWLFSGVFFVATAGAAVFERDWQTLGDGLLTFDDVNQREWLDLSETILDQFLGATLEDKYQSVVAETAPGGMFEDFTVAKGNDAEALALSAGIDVVTGDFDTNFLQTKDIIELLSATQMFSANRFFANGALDETASSPIPVRSSAFFTVVDRRSEGLSSSAGFGVNPIGERIGISNTGVMLYRHAIPEPNTFVLAFSYMLLTFMSKLKISKNRLRPTRVNKKGVRTILLTACGRMARLGSCLASCDRLKVA